MSAGDRGGAPRSDDERTPDADDAGSGPVPALSVSGGVGGIEARYADIATLGELYQGLGEDLAAAAWADRLEAADGDLLASAALSPDTFAAAEGAILDATYGPSGLVSRAVAVEAQSFAFTAVVELYRTADEVRHHAMEALSYGLGFAAGYHSVPVALTGAIGYATLWAVDPRLAGAVDDELVETLEDHPELLETLVNGGGGLLDGLGAGPVSGPILDVLGLGGFHPDTGSAAEDLGGLLFGDYEGRLDHAYDGPFFQHEPPRSVEDLLEDLGTVAAADVPDGVISIQRLTDADGRTSYLVQLPGTDSFTSEDAIRNMGSNLDLIAGDDTAYGQAVATAMEAAGVDRSAPVMLLGHSQGGMQAAALAADPDFAYHVTDVVTAGSPIATTAIPEDVNVLSLENTGDIVPALDGEPNSGAHNQTTVKADIHTGSFGAEDGQNHSLSTYEAIGGAVDASSDPSVVQAVEGLRAGGFLADPGAAVESTTFTFRTATGDLVRPAEIRDS